MKSATIRERTEQLGLLVTGILALVMLGFIVVHWGQHLPVLDAVYDWYRDVGRLLDVVLGTNVFRHPFMWQSLATGVFIGIVAPLVGTFVVHREMALIGETLAHTAFAGVAVGFLLIAFTAWDGPLLLVALVVAVIGALLVQWLIDQTHTYGDVPIAIMLSGSFALGTLLISWGRNFMAVAIDVEGFLFGSIAVVTVDGARLMAVLTVAVVSIVLYSYKSLLFITFDEKAARVAQFNVRWYNILLIIMTAVVVVGAMQVLGVILVAAMLVVPVAAATQVAKSFHETVILSILFGQIAVITGFAYSLTYSLPAGGSIVMAAIAIYILSILVGRREAIALSAR